ncbi:MAG: hypothetical protein MI866_13990, partial [Bacteroidales bacterium]|nr:hypothetical protein [Bacteroidales bacterium]
YPSLVDMCKLGHNNTKNEKGLPLGGFSLLPLMKSTSSEDWEGPEGALTAIATDVVDYSLDAQTFSYRTTDFRYIVYPDGSEELYDLETDPNEWYKVAAKESFNTSLISLRAQVKNLINTSQ